LTVRAALEHDRSHVYHAALLDPNASGTLSPDAICALVDDLIDAHGDALPAGIAARPRPAPRPLSPPPAGRPSPPPTPGSGAPPTRAPRSRTSSPATRAGSRD